ncbi:BglG family transcription antiterminator [Bacillus sp. MRMR6]|uniref:BglG family transcription antiterminator n=1 Tax=Bacillus sp. MRMR6 TaxID=1928617 RepID=UPI0009512A75|nr:BglG family transcription antiterminator [Bacillus sp. MRMR6]OLS35905.1 transcriptional antiterminator [Bacillus sp. MRMR6]
MNSRQKELLRLLLVREEGAMQVKDLAEELECGEKTVRNDLNRLEEFLLDFPSSSLTRKPGFGIAIEIDDEGRSKILQSLHSSEPKTNEERLVEIAFQLLTSEKAITLQYWADQYYVPKAEIKKDIEDIAGWLQRFDLELVSKQRLGNVIQGTELSKRSALAHLPELISTITSGKNVVLDLFLPYEISVVRKAIDGMHDKFKIAFTDGTIESLLVHALIMVKRTRQRSPVFVHDSEMKMVCERPEYQYASWFFGQLETTFSLSFPEEERTYFTWHLISGKRTEEGSHQGLDFEDGVTKIVHILVGKMSTLTQYPFDGDSILKNGLAMHMHSVVNRIKYGFPITNPLLLNIKKMYPYMFNMVILTLEEIKSIYGMEIPEDEAAYIVLHFQASIERLEGKRDSKKKALIVCHMGIGMSHLLEAKIEQQYQDIEILACVGKAEVSDYVRKNPVDFIISTIPLEKINHENIVISSLFGQEDKKKLSQFVEVLKQKDSEGQDQHPLLTFLKEDLLLIDVEMEHRFEVVEMLASALFERGYVQKEFVHSTVGRERKSATAIGGGISIPHGNPSLVVKSAVAAAILKKPLMWGNERVTLVLMLGLSKENQGENRSLIGKIAALSETPLMVHALSSASDYQDFVSILEKQK